IVWRSRPTADLLLPVVVTGACGVVPGKLSTAWSVSGTYKSQIGFVALTDIQTLSGAWPFCRRESSWSREAGTVRCESGIQRPARNCNDLSSGKRCLVLPACQTANSQSHVVATTRFAFGE